ncbi:WD40 repeat-like protein [Coprinellus micaceus]|uniref:WD40 repeat-like protein n=1 Tax=Coprinellus micaceus TaxID=71717 RepID=A0A4Y7SP71_COPMI|nr:WD40 repeat-like protein [Coprinellus micaceus]
MEDRGRHKHKAVKWVKNKGRHFASSVGRLIDRTSTRPPLHQQPTPESHPILGEGGSAQALTVDTQESSSSGAPLKRTQSSPTDIKPHADPLGETASSAPFPKPAPSSQFHTPDNSLTTTTPMIVHNSPHDPRIAPRVDLRITEPSAPWSNTAPQTNGSQIIEFLEPAASQPLPAASEHPTSLSAGATETSIPKHPTLLTTGPTNQTPALPSALDSPPDQTSQSKGTSSSTWYAAVKATLAAVERASDVFTPLKSAVAAVNVILETKDAFRDNQEDFERLGKRVDLLDAIMRSFPSDAPQELKDRRNGLERTVEDLARTLEAKTSRKVLNRLAFTKEDQQDVMRIVREINFAIEFAMFDVSVRSEGLVLEAIQGIKWLKDRTIKEGQITEKGIARVAEGVAKLVKSDTFTALGDVRGSGFSNGTRRGECIAGSRVGLVSQLLAWAKDPLSGHAFWLSGIAGTGKTAVSETFCSQLAKRGLLGASFFCSLTRQDLSDMFLVIPTLAKTMAKAHPTFGAELAQALEACWKQSQDPLNMKIEDQWRLLILLPAQKAFQGRHSSVTLCVDALDECGDRKAVKKFLVAILSNSPGPIPLKIFFTSRPESSMEEVLQSPLLSSLRQSLQLHNIEHNIVRGDIELYIHHSLGSIKALRDEYGAAWPPPEVQRIIERSDTLFIVAATIIREIDTGVGNRIERLRKFGGPTPQKLVGIHGLYRGIIEKVFVGLRPNEKEDLRSCLSLLVAACRPLAVCEYAKLLGMQPSTVRELLRPLHSMISIPPGGDDHPIVIYHASFVDFLTDEDHPTTLDLNSAHPWTIKKREAQVLVAEQCLTLMDDDDEGVFLGVSGAGTSYWSNSDQDLGLQSDLAYACTSWTDHVLGTQPIPSSLEGKVAGFLGGKWLYWLEALSASGSVGYARTLGELTKMVADNGLKELTTRIWNFWQMFATPISHSAPHIYLSALPFYEAALGASDWILPQFPSLAIVHSVVACLAISPNGNTAAAGSDDGILQLWDVQSGHTVGEPMKGHTSSVTSVCFSPDGSKIASGSWDESIRLWDAKSGRAVGEPMEGHTNWVTSVCFSPDGSKIASGSWDTSVRLWDVESGQAVGQPMGGHTDRVTSVCFSPDGSKIASGSHDKSVRLWDMESGQAVGEPMEGHTDSVTSVCFSPDGSKIASGSWDKSVRLWDMESGQAVGEPMEGHTNWVTSVCFSPDGSKIASGSYDNSVRLWDAESGQAVGELMDGHTNWVTSVCFSPDGSKIASGSLDKSVRLWDAGSEQAVGEPMEGHTDSVTSVCFSPDGSKIVSGSYNNSVRLWDAESGQAVGELMDGHTNWVTSVCFSPDGSKIASGSDNKSVRLWDMESGQAVGEPMEGHTNSVTSVCFSPDGSKIASGSWDKSIRLWNAESGQAVGEPMEGHTSGVTSVCFSPDGSKMASGSVDKSVRLWDMESGQAVGEPMEGHTSGVTSVCFSPDGSKIASGSWDKSVRLWNAESGQAVGEPMEGHTNWVTSVCFSPDGSKMASGSVDKSVRLWDMESGQAVGEPMEGHTSPVNWVCFSPDGTRIASGSNDKSIRVWRITTDSPTAHPSHLHLYPLHTFSMNPDGWICNPSGDLLLWIPPQFRISLQQPGYEHIVGAPATQVDLTQALYHGTNWHRCIEAPPNQPSNNLRWPVGTTRSDNHTSGINR